MTKRKINSRNKLAKAWPASTQLRGFGLGAALVSFSALPTVAQSSESLALFRDNCFSPFMTAERAAERFGGAGVRWDFYDLDPFSARAAPSRVTGRPATPGTDRRCEIAFDGSHVESAKATVAEALKIEGIKTHADVPDNYPAHPNTSFIAARQLNPRRIAVVQVGQRAGPNGTETFLSVERLTPLEVIQ